MKRSTLVVFLGIIILGVCGGTFNKAFATEENNFSVKTEVVSEDIKTYAENNLAVYLNGMLDIEGS